MNINLRIITDENVDQLLSMSYSNNINKLLHKPDDRNSENLNSIIKDYINTINNAIQMQPVEKNEYFEQPQIPTPVQENDIIDLSKLQKNIGEPQELDVYLEGDSPPYPSVSTCL